MNNLYSQELKEWNEHIFQTNPRWGNNPFYSFHLNGKTIDTEKIIKLLKPKSILDYGCGNAIILNTINQKFPDIKTFGYDPFVKEYNNFPTEPVDLVISYHAINHVEPEYWDDTLTALQNLTKSNIIIKLLITDKYPTRTYKWYADEFSKFFKVKNSWQTDQTVISGPKFDDNLVSFATFWMQK